MINLKDNTNCILCSFPLTSEAPLAVGPKISLMAGKHSYSDGIFLFARYIKDYDIEDDETENYYPKFYPECGKRINKDVRSE